MLKHRRILFCCMIVLRCIGPVAAQSEMKHFIFFSQDRAAIHDSVFYMNPGITGAQITYPWKMLEPQKDKYDFSAIESDMNFLATKGKRLFIQIQDVTFDSTFYAVPAYLMKDTAYHGGVNAQYDFPDHDESKAIKAGWVARRWDAAVATRFHNLLTELGKKFDGKIEGINLPESAVEFGEKGNLHPPGFTYEIYRDAIKCNMDALKRAFPQSVTIQYINFMPGEWLPENDHLYLCSLYRYAKEIHVGVGGPDIKVYKKYQMVHSYGYIRDSYGLVPTGVAVQDGNYDVINPKTGKKVTVKEIYDFGKDYLRLTYIFWCTEEPYYSQEVLPLLEKVKK